MLHEYMKNNDMNKNQAAQEQKFITMTTRPVESLILRMAVPAIVSVFITALYNMADTFFVSSLDAQSPAAVGIVFSYMALIQALAFCFGQGSAAYMSRALGRRDIESAARMSATGFFTVLILGVVIMILGLCFMDPLLYLLGSTETILPRARGYLRWILVGTPFIMASLVMNNQMRLQGNATMAAVGVASGAFLNIILDPILIFYFDMGTEGASLATAISQVFGFCILLHMTTQRDGIPPRIKNFRPYWTYYREIMANGMPSLWRQGLASIGIAFLNHAAGPWGDTAIAAFSIVMRIVMLSTSVVLGFGHGFQPVCGFNYGAGKFDRVRRSLKFCISCTTGYCVCMSIIGIIFAPNIIALFRSEPELIAVGAGAMRNQCFAYPLVGFIISSNMYLQHTRQTLGASIVAAARQGWALVPAVYIGTKFFGLSGLMAAQSTADALTFLTALPITLLALRNLERDAEKINVALDKIQG